MTATDCLTAPMLDVGMQHRARISFTRDQVDQYCALTGDANAIHRDRDAARQRFPGIEDVVVPGGLIQTTISAIFGTSFPGDGTLGLSFTPERMRQPICPGDEILVTLEVTRIKAAIVELDIKVDNGQGKRISGGTAKVIAPDEGYRNWWEAQGR